jgi:hypothetical protein
MSNPFDMYRKKKKRAVDPNAPPRPTLLGHEKVLKDARSTIDQQAHDIDVLRRRVEELERKMINQTAYLNAIHQNMIRRR